MNRIGILTLPFGPNYGMNLQVYALQTALEKLGYDAVVINRKWNRIEKNSGVIASIKRFVYFKFFVHKIYSFYTKRLHLSKPCYSSEDIAQLCKDMDISSVIVGSDQIWRIEHTRGANFDFFGGFGLLNSSVNILSYAASFGNNQWKGTEEETSEIKKLLSRFIAVSVREDSGVDMCKRLFNIDAKCTIDPTLLLTSSDYEKLLLEGICHKGQIVTYILDEKPGIRSFIQRIASARNNNEVLNLYPQKKSLYRTYPFLVEEWMSYIHNADFVITDSFHGMVFSIIFHKNFYVIANKKRGIERFVSLLGKLGIEDRLLYEDFLSESHYEAKSINYLAVEEKLRKLKTMSFDFLTSNIN